MCGIIGAIPKNQKSYNILSNCLDILTIRGTHAYGLAYYNKKDYRKPEYSLIKSTNLNLIKQKLYQACESKTPILFHNRYSTSGNWDDDRNNMPIQSELDGYISFNGVLEQSSPNHWQQKYGISDFKTENDIQILMKLNKKQPGIIQHIAKHPHWSIAAVILSETVLLGFRNNKRPLYEYKDENVDMFISSLDPVSRTKELSLDNVKIVKPMEIICLN